MTAVRCNQHLEIVGFEHGLHADSATGGMVAHAEDISMKGQKVAGVTVGATSLSLRNLKTHDVPIGLQCTSPQGFTALVDSTIHGQGLRKGIKHARFIGEWAHPKAYGAVERADNLRLRIEETPIFWANSEHMAQQTNEPGRYLLDETVTTLKLLRSQTRRDLAHHPHRKAVIPF